MSDQKPVHLRPNSDDWSSCGLWMPHSGMPFTEKRDGTTCLRCRSNFTNPTDSELAIELLAEKKRQLRGEI